MLKLQSGLKSGPLSQVWDQNKATFMVFLLPNLIKLGLSIWLTKSEFGLLLLVLATKINLG